MQKYLACAFLAAALVCGVAIASQNQPITIQNETRTIVESGQTFDLTAIGITVDVVFSEVTSTRATGTVQRTGGGASGTFRIYWHETGLSQELKLSISNPSKAFSLEGGDTDKKKPDQVGS